MKSRIRAKKKTSGEVLPFRQHGEFSHPTHAVNELFASVEIATLPFFFPFLWLGAPRGDDSPVILVPGMGIPDAYLLALYLFLKAIGYDPYFSGMGIVADCPQKLLDRLKKTIDQVYTGKRIHLIGYSLGGIICRSAANHWPKQIASTLSIESPIRGLVAHKFVFTVSDLLRWFAQELDPKLPSNCGTSHCSCKFVKSLSRQLSPDVFSTTIYSRFDGLVDGEHCRGRGREADEVLSTHIGAPFNAQVLWETAKHLRQACEFSTPTLAR